MTLTAKLLITIAASAAFPVYAQFPPKPAPFTRLDCNNDYLRLIRPYRAAFEAGDETAMRAAAVPMYEGIVDLFQGKCADEPSAAQRIAESERQLTRPGLQ